MNRIPQLCLVILEKHLLNHLKSEEHMTTRSNLGIIVLPKDTLTRIQGSIGGWPPLHPEIQLPHLLKANLGHLLVVEEYVTSWFYCQQIPCKKTETNKELIPLTSIVCVFKLWSSLLFLSIELHCCPRTVHQHQWATLLNWVYCVCSSWSCDWSVFH